MNEALIFGLAVLVALAAVLLAWRWGREGRCLAARIEREASQQAARQDREARQQVDRLAQKTASLEILYGVAEQINQCRGLDELARRFLDVLRDMVSARAAAVWLPDGEMLRLAAASGLVQAESLVKAGPVLPVEACVSGEELLDGDVLLARGPQDCAALAWLEPGGHGPGSVLVLPLRHQQRVLGVYHLFVEGTALIAREDVLELLVSVARPLAVAIENARHQEERQLLSIRGERAALGRELHDSLAQTLASLRFRMRVLTDMLAKGEPVEAMREAERIFAGIEQANTEVRELLAHFRAPVDERGLVPALDALVSRFRRESGIASFFHQTGRTPQLAAAEELQVLRIVQEALANVRRHSGAHMARVILRGEPEGLSVIVEDDGAGFAHPATGGQGDGGEHVGLSIMRERSQRLGADLRIESEAGEGTRVELSLRVKEKEVADARIDH